MLQGLEAVLDVGGEYDPSRDRFDHHQRGFADVFGHGFNTKLSSAGLVYKVRPSSLPACCLHSPGAAAPCLPVAASLRSSCIMAKPCHIPSATEGAPHPLSIQKEAGLKRAGRF